jgi:N-methylhydantoinase A
MYGYSRVDSPVEIVTVRLRAWIKTEAPKIASGARKTSTQAKPAESTSVTFGGREVKANVLDRSRLVPGNKHSGPAIITEYSATTVVPPRWKFHIDKSENLILEQMK